MQGQFGDPLAEEFALREPRRCDWDFDPMIQESQRWEATACHHPAICYSPDDDAGRVESPVYVPISGTFVTGVMQGHAGDFNTHCQGGDDILFGPGVQL
jgi:hypothetical protein